MMLVPSGVRVHIALGVTDMRKGLDGLAMLVREVLKRDCFAKALILLLEMLQLFQLIGPHAAVLLSPTVIGLLPDADLADRIYTGHTLANHNFYLA